MRILRLVQSLAATLLLLAGSVCAATDRLPAPDLSGFTFTPAGSSASLLAVDRSGRILLSGTFTAVNGVPAAGVVRIGIDNQVDAAWRPSFPLPLVPEVAFEEPGGSWLLAGTWYEAVAQGTAMHGELYRVDGTTGATVQKLYASGGDRMSALAIDPAGRIYVAVHVRGSPNFPFGPSVDAHVYRLSSAGITDPQFAVRLSGAYGCFITASTVHALVHDGLNRLYIGGNFAGASGGSSIVGGPGIVGIATDVPSVPAAAGSEKAAPKLTCFDQPSSIVNAIALGSDGDLYLGGGFGLIRTLAASPSTLNGRGGFTRPGGFGSFTTILSLALDPVRHRLYVAGNFTAVDGTARLGLAALSSLGNMPLDAAWAPSEGAGSPILGVDRLFVRGNSAGNANIAFAFPLAGTSIMHHYYQSILGRAPDPSAFGYWPGEIARLTNLGADPREAYIAMAMYFFGSPEFLSTPLTNAQFVDRLFLAFFNRAADPSGGPYWTRVLDSGLPREMVMFAFMFSPEFDAYMNSILGQWNVRPEVSVTVDFYRGILARLPDAAGLKYWVNRFRTAQCRARGADVTAGVKATANDVSASFLNSAEYLNGAPSNAAYVSDLYNAFLRRGADTAGFNHWMNVLSSGATTREQVRLAFLDSPEFGARIGAIASQPCVAPMP